MKKILLTLIIFIGQIQCVNGVNVRPLRLWFKTCEKERLKCWKKAVKDVKNISDNAPGKKPLDMLKKVEQDYEACMLDVNEKKRKDSRYYCDIWKDQINTDYDWNKYYEERARHKEHHAEHHEMHRKEHKN